MNSICKEDIANIIKDSADLLQMLDGKTILVTGATGLIGYVLGATIAEYGKSCVNPPKLIAVVRDMEKTEKMYGDYISDNLQFVVGSIEDKLELPAKIDYVVHGASITSSKAFVDKPVDVIRTAINGTWNMLDLAQQSNCGSFVYLSSMEVYGAPTTEKKISENDGAVIDTMSVRSSYSEGKRMCENLVCSFCSQYGVPAKVARLTQTMGPTVSYNDNRVFAEFARCAIEKKDIVLHTKGETKRNYLYITDAITGILTILLRGENGKAYNVANEDAYCSIYEMAKMVSEKIANNKISVNIKIEDENKFGYNPVMKMNLDTSCLKNLGWSAKVGLREMYERLCVGMKNSRTE